MFSPLNLKEDPSSKKELEEDHTREIEIENAFNTYQKAIALQELGDLLGAYAVYQELSASTIISGHYYDEVDYIRGAQNGYDINQVDELSFVAQNVKNLRYLYLRNRAFLHLSILRAGPQFVRDVFQKDRELRNQATEDLDPDASLTFFKELFYTMLDNLVGCMMYQEADDTVFRLLFDVYTYLDFKRLAKFTFELAQSFAAESDDLMSILPINNWVVKLRSSFLAWLKSGETTLSVQLLEKLAFLDPIKKDLAIQLNKIYALNGLEVPVKANANWADVLNSLMISLRKNQDRDKAQSFAKYPELDPYLASEYSCDYIEFKFDVVEIPASAEIVEVSPVQEDDVTLVDVIEISPLVDTVEIQTPAESMPLNEAESSVSEKASMRISRRLNPDELNPLVADNIVLLRRYFVETEAFFELINAFHAEISPGSLPVLSDVIQFLVSPNPNSLEPLYTSDFVRTLNEWKLDFYEDTIIFREKSDSKTEKSKADSDKAKLIEVLTRFGNQSSFSQTIPDSIDDTEDTTSIKKTLSEITAKKLPLVLVRLEILAYLFLSISDLSWSPDLIDAVCEWVTFYELDLFEHFKRSISSTVTRKDIVLMLGIYEMLANQFILVKKQVEDSTENLSEISKATKSSNSSFLKVLNLKDRLNRWKSVLKDVLDSDVLDSKSSPDMSLIIRYYWVSNYVIASESLSWSEKKYAVIHLHQLQTILNHNSHPEIRISFPNYDHIGEFSFENLHRRLSTASILAIFCKILNSNGLKLDGNDDTIALLEAILIENGNENASTNEDSSQFAGDSLVNSVIHGRATLDSHSLESVKNFLNECPVDLRLNLWNILFLYYEKDSIAKYQGGFEQYLDFMLSFLLSPGYLKCQRERPSLLLQLISSFDGYLKVFLRNLAVHKWQLPNLQFDDQVILNIGRVFQLSYCFSLHEESALITGRKISVEVKSPAAFNYFKDFVIDCITILLVYFFAVAKNLDSAKREEFIAAMIIVVHNQLGIRRLCDSSNGLFLRFAEDVLMGLRDVPDKELAQILSCRFHYKVKLNGQFPIDHYTEKVGKLDKVSAEELASFILPFCFRKNPLTHNPRNDLKQVVEDLYEIIGDPDLESDETLLVNVSNIKKFCEQTLLTPRFVKEAFHGLQHIPLQTPRTRNVVAEHGLYFMEAILMFNFYKIRKKSAQSRTVELEKIVSFLIFDLAYGSNRVESWILLGQAYSFLVEDDLIWTSDKLNIIERKVVTANSQRKSLVSYLMAISIMTHQRMIQADVLKLVVAMLMSSFAKELYSACFAPMDMTAFMAYPNPRLLRANGQTSISLLSEKPLLTKLFCLKLMLQCILLSIRSNEEDWSSFYYLAKIKAKLRHKPLDVLEVVKQASSLAKNSSVPGDLILEPAYKYFSLLYKYLRRDEINASEAMSLLVQEPSVCIEVSPAFISKESVFISLVNCFGKISTMDKKGWYHKPSYRQAFIVMNEFHDLKKAKEIMSKYFSLKSTTKTFLQLWKPENERAGKHFVYMYQYARFYITVLTQERDLTSLVNMFPKLRKANSTMVLLYYAWDHMCSSLCKFIRQVFGIEENSVEKFLSANNHALFVSQARILVDNFDSEKIPEPTISVLCSLNILSEMRKLNNGFGPTSLIDDTFTAFFLMIFNEIIHGRQIAEDIIAETPAGKVKKLAKKDLFPFAIELTAKSKRFTDSYLKEHPNIFNEFVSQYELRIKQMWAMLQLVNYQNRVQALSHIQRVNFDAEAAKSWWLFEQKLSMKKMLYSTIPDSKRLIQQDEDELVELPGVQELKPSTHVLSAIVSQPQLMNRSAFAPAVTDHPMAQNLMGIVPAKYLNPVELDTAMLSRLEVVPTQGKSSDSSQSLATSSHHLTRTADDRTTLPQENKVKDSPSETGEGTANEKSQFSIPSEDPKFDKIARSGPNTRSMEVIDLDSRAGSEAPLPKATSPPTTIHEDSIALTKLQSQSLEVQKTDSLPAAESSLHKIEGAPELISAQREESIVGNKGLGKEVPIIIEEPNEPIFVPRRRSSRQRENLLKTRLNGLSKDVPIVVEIEDEGPKRSPSEENPLESVSKRRKGSNKS